MRIVTKFIGVLVAMWLFAMPVMGISAQGGTSMPTAVLPETGMGGELQTVLDGLLYEGFAYGPEIAPSGLPVVLPEAGASRGGLTGWELQTLIENLRYEGFAYALDMAPSGPPEALPVTGSGWELQTLIEGLRYEGFAYALDMVPSEPPVALPATGSVTGSDLIYRVSAPWFSTASAIWSDDVIRTLAGVSVGASVQP